jgi:hypothetical protein
MSGKLSEAVSLVPVTFRRATLEVEYSEDFYHGVICGQSELIERKEPLTGKALFRLFDDLMHEFNRSEDWIDGYLLGLSDSILRNRQRYPPGFLMPLPRMSLFEE